MHKNVFCAFMMWLETGECKSAENVHTFKKIKVRAAINPNNMKGTHMLKYAI